jgi:hypothetical protein
LGYPYAPPSTGKANNSVTKDDHPQHHDTLAAALGDLLDELGAGPKGAAADLTARMAAVDLALQSDWRADTTTWTRVSNTQFTLAVDATGWLAPGTRVRWKESGAAYKYGVVATSAFSAGTTTVNLIGTDDYVMAASPDANSTSYSSVTGPNGFPAFFNYTPTRTGYSANPTTTAFTWRTMGRTIVVTIREGSAGISSSTTKTYSLPANVTAVTLANQLWENFAQVTNNGSSGGGQLRVSSGATVIDAQNGVNGGAWTASGSAAVNHGSVFCEF